MYLSLAKVLILDLNLNLIFYQVAYLPTINFYKAKEKKLQNVKIINILLFMVHPAHHNVLRVGGNVINLVSSPNFVDSS